MSTGFHVILQPPWNRSSHTLSSYVASANRLSLSSVGTKDAGNYITWLFSSGISANAHISVAVYASHLHWICNLVKAKLQMPLTSGASGWVVEATFNVQTAGLTLEKDVISLVIYPASLLYSQIFDLSLSRVPSLLALYVEGE